MNSKNNNNNNNIIHFDCSDKENKNIINVKNILQKKKNLIISSNNNLIEWGYKEIMKRKLKLKNKYNNNNNNKYKFSENTNISQRNKKSFKLISNKNKSNRSNSNDSYKKYKNINTPNNENSKLMYHYKSPNFLIKKNHLNNKNLLINTSFVCSNFFLNISNENNVSKKKNKKEKFLKIVNTSNFPKITEIQNYNIKLLNKNNSKKTKNNNNFNKTNSTHNFYKKYQNLNLYKNLLFPHKYLNSFDNINESNEEKNIEKFKYKIGEIILNKYEIISKIGEGTFGLCLKCFDLIEKEFICIKIIKNIKNSQIQKNNNEIEILNLLKNNKNINLVNIIKLKNSFIYKNYYFLVFELLYNNLYIELKLNNFKGYDLNIIKKIATQILFCLLYLKKNNIIHCDIKPENILFSNKSKNDIKLIDFGSSCFNNKKQKYFYIQSRFYRAPEILLSKEYDFGIDMWSLGCILCELFIGYPIFPGENEDDMIKIIKNFSEKKGIFYDIFNDKNIDKDFIDFLKQCLTINFKNRIKPEEALKHKWIVKNINLNGLQNHYDKINKIIE